MWLLILFILTIVSLVSWVWLENKLMKGTYILMALLVISIFGLSASICYYIGTSDWPLWVDRKSVV